MAGVENFSLTTVGDLAWGSLWILKTKRSEDLKHEGMVSNWLKNVGGFYEESLCYSIIYHFEIVAQYLELSMSHSRALYCTASLR